MAARRTPARVRSPIACRTRQPLADAVAWVTNVTMEDARSFAVAAHADQRYGDQPYEVHLAAVVQVLRDFAFGPAPQAAGWLHDVVEDTAVPLSDIRDRFGDAVAAMVDAVTGIGATREERNARIYAGLRACPEAAAVKLADRIANVEAAPAGSRHLARYRGEAGAFADVVRPHVPPAMWQRLDAALEARA